MSKFLFENFNFQDQLSTFRGVNRPKIIPFKAKNEAQTLRKQLQNNFEKVHNTDFFDTQNTGANFAKSIEFLVHFRTKNP